jgi:hypothetical protein
MFLSVLPDIYTKLNQLMFKLNCCQPDDQCSHNINNPEFYLLQGAFQCFVS